MNPLEVLLMGKAKSGSGDGGFKVTFTSVDSYLGNEWHSDKTYQEVHTALSDGKLVYGVDDNYTYICTYNQLERTKAITTQEIQFFTFSCTSDGTIYAIIKKLRNDETIENYQYSIREGSGGTDY